VTNPSKVEKIQTHFQALSSAATSLNTASDELAKVVGVLDEALRKLNVGLPVWVTVSRWEGELRRGQDEIGYCRVSGKWGIALCRSWNDDAGGEDTIEGLWLFNDAPRELRLAGVDKLPEVIEALSKEAFETTKKVQEKTKEARELASVIERITNQPSRTEQSKKTSNVVGVGLSFEQRAAILAGVEHQQKFVRELLGQASRWELSHRDLRIYFPTAKRPLAELLEGRESLSKVSAVAKEVLGYPVQVAVQIEPPTIDGSKASTEKGGK